MKIATWNVNSLKVRLPQVLDWLALNQPDVLCLQETKLEDENFPVSEIEAAGYHATYSGQKTYNGVVDSFRLFEQPEKSFSWWDYRMMAFRRNMGLRIDHILLSSDLAKTCTACVIDKATRKLERPSDHAPVMVELTRHTD